MDTQSEIHLIKETGISPGNYKWWPSKEECDQWFLGKAFEKLEDYCYIRANEESMHGYNVGCIHVDLPYSAVTTCDYLSYKNPIFEDRWFHCAVTSREYVNEKTCRIYFVVDYVASYWDTITLGKSFIERTHVGDDWASPGVESASKYLLPEPFAIEIRHRPELLTQNPFDEVNRELFFDQCKFNLVTTISDDGQINSPKINYQAGGAISGYLYTGDQNFIEEKLSKYVSFSSQLVVRAESILNHVSSIYLCPIPVIGNQTNTPEYSEVKYKFSDLTKPILPNEKDEPGVRHAKVFDYFRYRIIGNTNDVILTPAECKSQLWANVAKTGGPYGRYSVLFNDTEGYLNGVATQTMTWPTVAVSATVNAYEYKLNPKIKEYVSSEWDKKEARKAAWLAAHQG